MCSAWRDSACVLNGRLQTQPSTRRDGATAASSNVGDVRALLADLVRPTPYSACTVLWFTQSVSDVLAKKGSYLDFWFRLLLPLPAEKRNHVQFRFLSFRFPEPASRRV